MTFRRVGRGADERGSATIWLLGCVPLLVLVAVVVTVRSAAVLARHRAEAAADLAALAAAGRLGSADPPCPAAERWARSNGATVTACRVQLGPDGRSGTVTVRVAATVNVPVVGARTVTADARAGRASVRAGIGCSARRGVGVAC